MSGRANVKRKADDEGVLVVVKKTKTDLVVAPGSKGGVVATTGPARTSNLLAPTMLLTGHAEEVFTAKFSPSGNTLASAGFDRQLMLWHTFGECASYAVMQGHQGAVLDLHWTTDGAQLVTASTDFSCGVWDAEVGERIRRLRGHGAIVNSACPSRVGTQIVSGSDDGTVRLWDSRYRHHVHMIETKYPVTAVCFNEDGTHVIAGGLDNAVRVWDLRNQQVLHTLSGHTDTVTSVALSPGGTHVLSNGMDNTVRMWDIRPYAPDRLTRVFKGASHNFEKNLIKCAWTPDGKHVGAGSADRNVYVWDAASGKLDYLLPGHKGTVNEVAFHPTEPIVLSCSSDKKLFLGELAL